MSNKTDGLNVSSEVQWSKIVSEYDQEIPHHKLQTNPWHREDEPQYKQETPGRQTAKQPALSLFPIKMIAKLEET